IMDIETQLFLGNEDRALEMAKPFREGRYERGPYADCFCMHLLLPLLKQKKTGEGAKLAKRCRPYFRPQQCYLWPYGELIKWHALTGNEKTAVKMYDRCQSAITPFSDPMTRLHFCLDNLVLFDQLNRTGPSTVILRSKNLRVFPHDERYRVGDLREW